MKHKLKGIKTGQIFILEENEYDDFCKEGVRAGYFLYIESIPENIEDEDLLKGHPYPGHETWED